MVKCGANLGSNTRDMRKAMLVLSLLVVMQHTRGQTPGWDGGDCDLHARGFMQVKVEVGTGKEGRCA